MDKVHVYTWFNIASNEYTAENKTRLFLSPFLYSTDRFLVLAKTFRNDHVVACRTALRSATEKNENGGYITIPSFSEMAQRSSTADWLKFWWRHHQIGCDGIHKEQIFTFKVTLCKRSCKIIANLLTLSILI